MKQYDTLNITHPDIAKEWHPTKNGALLPSDVSCGSGKMGRKQGSWSKLEL